MSPGSLVRLEGFGERYSGNYYVESVEHSVAQSFTTRLELRRNAVSRSGVTARRRSREQDEPLRGRVNDESPNDSTGWTETTDRDGNRVMRWSSSDNVCEMPPEWEMDW